VAGRLNATRRQERHVIQVPPQTALLRIAMNAIGNGSDFNLFVKAASPPTPTDFDCRRNDSGQFAYCQFDNPPAGPWHILIQQAFGNGPYQVVGTTFDRTEIPVFCHGIEATIVGTEEDDTLMGTPGGDVIAGLAGNDVIEGLEGNDVLCGGPGDDTIDGGPGHDRLFGNEGNDVLQGGDGNDRLWGEDGHDRLVGGPGDDILSGGAGGDVLACGPGIDVVNGGEGTDAAGAGCEARVAIP
jgi:Ca2+-binding RTX toxin-like protein